MILWKEHSGKHNFHLPFSHKTIYFEMVAVSVKGVQLDTPCKAGARSTLYVLDRTFFLSTNSKIRDRRAPHVTWRQVWVCRPIAPYPGEIWVLSPGSFFLKFWKSVAKLVQKRVRNGSPSVPLLSLKARFWRFYFSFFQTLENPCLKLPSVLSNVHPPIYQSQKSIISRTDGRTDGRTNISDLAV